MLFERNILSRASLLIYALCVRQRGSVCGPLLERIDTYTRKNLRRSMAPATRNTLLYIRGVCVSPLAWCLSCHRDIVIALRIVLRVIARHIYVGSEKKTFKRFFKFSSLKVSDLFFTFIFIIKGGFLCPSSEVPSFIIKCRKNFFC